MQITYGKINSRRTAYKLGLLKVPDILVPSGRVTTRYNVYPLKNNMLNSVDFSNIFGKFLTAPA